jgi:hypothetical protein
MNLLHIPQLMLNFKAVTNLIPIARRHNRAV